MSKIDKIKSVIDSGGGPADPSRYITIIAPPNALAGDIVGSVGSAFSSGFNFQSFQNIFSSILQGVDIAQQLLVLPDKIESVSLPGRSFMTTDYIMYGTSIKHPYGVQFSPVSMSIMCTESMAERKFFESWHRIITDPYSNNFRYWDEYTSAAIVILKVANDGADTSEAILDTALESVTGGLVDSNTFGVVLQEAYPVNVAAQQLSFANTEMLKLQVDFSYRRYLTLGDILNPLSLF